LRGFFMQNCKEDHLSVINKVISGRNKAKVAQI
jgi:hypothetical protein